MKHESISKAELHINYLDSNGKIAAEIRLLAGINLEQAQTSADKAEAIIGYCHNLFDHDGNDTPSSLDPITIINEANAGNKFRCVEYANLAVWLLSAHGVAARTIGLKTEDVETKEYGAGHVVMEYWDEQLEKWVMGDPQTGLMVSAGGMLLSAYELREQLYSGGDVDLVPQSGVDLQTATVMEDGTPYLQWLKEYLYFIDTKTQMRWGYTGSQMRDDQIIMLTPENVKPPKTFQGMFSMNALYTTNPSQLYQPP